jgi:hypothetical protein
MIRARYLALAALTVAAGLSSRAIHTGWYAIDKSLGDALYAGLIYWLLGLIQPCTRVRLRAAIAVSICFAIEAFKLTGLPMTWSDSRLSRLIFGTTPSVHNLICYLAGIAAAAVLDGRIRQCRARLDKLPRIGGPHGGG